MKAKDLIKILEKNPEQEVKFYNSFVDDWMNISVDEHELVKEKPSYILMLSNLDRKQKGLPEHTLEDIKKYKRGSEWEFKNDFADYERDKKHYSFKNIFLIQGKSRNKTTFDRLGEISY